MYIIYKLSFTQSQAVYGLAFGILKVCYPVIRNIIIIIVIITSITNSILVIVLLTRIWKVWAVVL